MAVLPYCVVLADEDLVRPRLGVNDAAVESIELEALRLFYSNLDDSVLAPESLRKSALEFHRVVALVFRQNALVPFRFPNLIQSREALESHLREKAGKYKDFLEKNRGTVQMEIVVPPAPIAALPAGEKSGTEYLLERQLQVRAGEQLAASVREKIADLISEFRQRDSRFYLLVRRERVDALRERLRNVPEIRLSGPWPASEFLEP